MTIPTQSNYHLHPSSDVSTPPPHVLFFPPIVRPANLCTTPEIEKSIQELAKSPKYADLPWGEKICEALKLLGWIDTHYILHTEIETIPFLELSQTTKDALEELLDTRLKGKWQWMDKNNPAGQPFEYEVEISYRDFLSFIKSAREYSHTPIESISIIGSQVPKKLEMTWLKQSLFHIASASQALTNMIEEADLSLSATGRHKSDLDTFFNASGSRLRSSTTPHFPVPTMAQQALECFIYKHLEALNFSIIYDDDTDHPIFSFEELVIHLSDPYNINRKDRKAITRIEVTNDAIPWLKQHVLSGRILNEFYKSIQNSIKTPPTKEYGFIKHVLLIGCSYIFQQSYDKMLEFIKIGVFPIFHDTTVKRISHRMECRDHTGNRLDFTFVESIDTATVRVASQGLRLEIQPAISGEGIETARLEGTHTALLHYCCGILSFEKHAVSDHTKWAFYWWRILKGQQLVGTSYKEAELHQTLLGYCSKFETKTIGLGKVLTRWLKKSITEPDPALAFCFFFNPLTHLPEGFPPDTTAELWKIFSKYCASIPDPLLEPLASPLREGKLDHHTVASFLHILAFQYLLTPDEVRKKLPYKAYLPKHGDKRMIRLAIGEYSFLFQGTPFHSYKTLNEAYRNPKQLVHLQKIIEAFGWHPSYAYNPHATLLHHKEEIPLAVDDLHESALEHLSSGKPVLIKTGYSLLLLSLTWRISKHAWVDAWSWLPKILEYETSPSVRKALLENLQGQLAVYEPALSTRQEKSFREFLKTLYYNSLSIHTYHEALLKTQQLNLVNACLRLDPPLSREQLQKTLIDLTNGYLDTAFQYAKLMQKTATLEGSSWRACVEAIGNAAVNESCPLKHLSHFYSLTDLLKWIIASYPQEKTAIEPLIPEWVRRLLINQKTAEACNLAKIAAEQQLLPSSAGFEGTDLISTAKREVEINRLIETSTPKTITGNMKKLGALIDLKNAEESTKARGCLQSWIHRFCGSDGGKLGLQTAQELLEIPLSQKLFDTTHQTFADFCKECTEKAIQAWLPQKRMSGVFSFFEFSYNIYRESDQSLDTLLDLLISVLHHPHVTSLPLSFAQFLQKHSNEIGACLALRPQPDIFMNYQQGLIKCKFTLPLPTNYIHFLLQAASASVNETTSQSQLNELITALPQLEIEWTPETLDLCIHLAHALFDKKSLQEACLLFETVVQPQAIRHLTFYTSVLPAFSSYIPVIASTPHLNHLAFSWLSLLQEHSGWQPKDLFPLLSSFPCEALDQHAVQASTIVIHTLQRQLPATCNESTLLLMNRLITTLISRHNLKEALKLLHILNSSEIHLWNSLFCKIAACTNKSLKTKALDYAAMIPHIVKTTPEYRELQLSLIKITIDLYLNTGNPALENSLIDLFKNLVDTPIELYSHINLFLDNLQSTPKIPSLSPALLEVFFDASQKLPDLTMNSGTPHEKMMFTLKLFKLLKLTRNAEHFLRFGHLLCILLKHHELPPKFIQQIPRMIIPLIHDAAVILGEKAGDQQEFAAQIETIIAGIKGKMIYDFDILDLISAMASSTCDGLMKPMVNIALHFLDHKLHITPKRITPTKKGKPPITTPFESNSRQTQSPPVPVLEQKLQTGILDCYSKLLTQLLGSIHENGQTDSVFAFLTHPLLAKILGEQRLLKFNHQVTKTFFEALYISSHDGIQPFVQEVWNYIEGLKQTHFCISSLPDSNEPGSAETAAYLKKTVDAYTTTLIPRLSGTCTKDILKTYIYASMHYFLYSCRIIKPLDIIKVDQEINALVKKIEQHGSRIWIKKNISSEKGFDAHKELLDELFHLNPQDKPTIAILFTNIWLRIAHLLVGYPNHIEELRRIVYTFTFSKSAIFAEHLSMHHCLAHDLLYKGENHGVIECESDAKTRYKLHLYLRFRPPEHCSIKTAHQKKYLQEIVTQAIESQNPLLIARCALLISRSSKSLFKDDFSSVIDLIEKILNPFRQFSFDNQDLFDALAAFSPFLNQFIKELPAEKFKEKLGLWKTMNALLLSYLKAEPPITSIDELPENRFESTLRFACDAIHDGWLKNTSPHFNDLLEQLAPYARQWFINFQTYITMHPIPVAENARCLQEFTETLYVIYNTIGISASEKWLAASRMIWTSTAKLLLEVQQRLPPPTNSSPLTLVSTALPFLKRARHLNMFGTDYTAYLELLSPWLPYCLSSSDSTYNKVLNLRTYFELITTYHGNTQPQNDGETQLCLRLSHQWKQALADSKDPHAKAVLWRYAPEFLNGDQPDPLAIEDVAAIFEQDLLTDYFRRLNWQG